MKDWRDQHTTETEREIESLEAFGYGLAEPVAWPRKRTVRR